MQKVRLKEDLTINKLIAIVLSLVLTLSLMACAKTEPASNANNSSSTAQKSSKMRLQTSKGYKVYSIGWFTESDGGWMQDGEKFVECCPVALSEKA